MKKLVQFAGIFILATTLFSCSNDNEPTSEPQKSSLKLQLNYAKTKAIEGQSNGDAPTITSAVITLRDAGNQNILQRILDSNDLDAINDKSGPGLILEDIPKMATSVEIIANGNVTQTDINDYQSGIKNVPYQGVGAITYTSNDTNTDGHVLKKAIVKMSAYLTRLEVVGGIPVTIDDNGLFAIDVDTIYINNISLKPDSAPTFNAGNLINQSWKDKTVYTNANGTFRNMWDTLSVDNRGKYENSIGIVKNKAAAYQLFPYDSGVNSSDAGSVAEKMFHIILKVKVYKTATDKSDSKPLPNMNYITIRSITTDSARISKLERGTIYRVDLAGLKDYFKPGVTPPIDPEPEAGKVDLAVTATVLPWTIVNAKPEL